MAFDRAEVSGALKALLAALPTEKPDVSSIPNRRLAQLRAEINAVIERLNALIIDLDPVIRPTKVFDPADPLTVGELIAKTMLSQERVPLSSVARFYGSGVYAIYYHGDFPAYGPITGTQTPIYVGKADPETPGARTPEQQGDRLWIRLDDHLGSVTEATNLKAADFDCRFLVVRSAWQNTAESYLIDRFRPVWNREMKVCFGFGKHGDKDTTRVNKRSPWDTVHPGRAWAAGSPNHRFTADEIIKRIAAHYVTHAPQE